MELYHSEVNKKILNQFIVINKAQASLNGCMFAFLMFFIV